MAFILMACASTPPVVSPAPVNAPPTNPVSRDSVPPSTAPVVPLPKTLKAWSFTYAPGTYTYSITTDATIAPVGDTAQKQQVPELSQRATIAISGSGDVQVITPAPLTQGSCTPDAALTMRAQQLLPRIPNQLAIGQKWRDSTTTTGCRGMIPAESTVISNYLVVGDTTIANAQALQIQRTDSISANGEGSSGQHRILVSATGIGSTYIFLDFTTGRLINVNETQSTLVNVTTSGRLQQFIQHVTEAISLAGLR